MRSDTDTMVMLFRMLLRGAIRNRLFRIFILFVLFICFFPAQAAPKKRKLIIVSLDGLPGYYFSPGHKARQYMPNLLKLFNRSRFSTDVISSNPTVTFPAHTSMITGVDPAVHGIINNRPHDIFERNLNGWMWYDEDIRVKTLWDFARKSHKTVGNIYWPVSVGADITFNLPQYFRAKNLEDRKVLRALSGKKLYDDVQKISGVYIHEYNSDAERMAAGIALYRLKKPDLLFIYLPDIDIAHHGSGVNTSRAFAALGRADKAIGLLIKETKLYKRSDLALIIISDHGFLPQKSLCYPNRVLAEMNLLDAKKYKYKFSFRTSMGMAALTRASGEQDEFPFEEFEKKITAACPGTRIITEGDEYNRLAKQWLPDTEFFLIADSGMGFAGSPFAGPAYDPKYSSSAHGFMNTVPELRTVGSFYPPAGAVKKIRNVKDVFPNACSWLRLKCKAGEKRKGLKK